MKKSTHWAGFFAMSICSATALGCSGDPAPSPPPTNTAGTTSTGGASGMAGSATGGAPAATGTQLQSPNYFVKLTGADAAPGQPAPAGYTAPTTSCGTCHGANGEGVAFLAPDIRFTPKEYAVAVVRGGRKTPMGTDSAMVPFGTDKISDADLDAINTWQNSFTKPTTPQGMYLAMCGNCHGPTTPTGGSAPISIQGKSKVDVAMYVRNGNGTDYTMRATYMPKFDTTLLTDADLALIEMYLGSQ